MGNVTAVLIDTVAIQRYVFDGNKLKENIGASNNVRDIYRDRLQICIKDVIGSKVSFNAWLEHPEIVHIIEPGAVFEVGYIGGGNALLFFKEKNQAEAFVQLWTKKLLVEIPGIQVAVALDEKFDIECFAESLERLFNLLSINKNRFFPQTILPKHGITADCPLSGLSAENFFLLDDEERYISSVAYAKLRSESKAVEEWLDEDDRKRYTFTDNINLVGQAAGKDYIAIVHIDGNDMGERFKKCRTLTEIRLLSGKVNKIMDTTFIRLVHNIVERMQFFLNDKYGFKISESDEKKVLPIRPILIAGDDITFVTDGRLGVPLAEQYLQLLVEIGKCEFSACAGVAITKTKYPFYMGYQLAEALCANAKQEARKNPGTSWLDFHLAYGGFSGSLKDIRVEKYSIRDGRLNYGPYLVTVDGNHEKSIQHLKEGIKKFSNTEQWPRSKVKELRKVLTLGRESAEQFINERKSKNCFLPEIPGKGYHVKGFENNVTPYFEMIELSEFYPIGLMDDKGGTKNQ
ncbi:MAG: hypothetical protein ACM3WV_06965 [Bacillota bacterium]